LGQFTVGCNPNSENNQIGEDGLFIGGNDKGQAIFLFKAQGRFVNMEINLEFPR
jgi:hypothetical protein